MLWYVAYAEAYSFSFLAGIASLVVVGTMVGMLVGTATVLIPGLLFGGMVIYLILSSLFAS